MFYLTNPDVREADVFTRMPEKFRKPDVRTEWARANRGGMVTDSFLEGPVWDPAGYLFVTDIPHGRIFRISPSGDWDLVVEYDGEPNGMKRFDAAHLIITDYRNGLMLLDIERGEIRPYLERRNTERFKGVNDLTFDSAGNIYFTDQGRPGCTIRRAACIGSRRTASSTCCSAPARARTGSCCRATRRCCSSR